MAENSQSVATVVVTDEHVGNILKDMLKEIDIASISMREIRRILQEKIGEGFNVEERKDFVKEIVESLLMEDDNNDDNDEQKGEQNEDMIEEDVVSGDVKEETNKRKSGGGFAKPLLLSEELAEFMGGKIASRTEVTKKIWEYIKANNLQNPANRREILCDEKFEKLMKRKKINMFKMTQVLNPMMKRLQDLQASCFSDDEDSDSDGANNQQRKAGQKRKISATVSVKNEKKTAKSKNNNSDSDNDSDDDNHDKKRIKALPKKKKQGASSSLVGQSVLSDPLKVHMKKKSLSSSTNNSTSGLYVHPDLLSVLGVTEIETRPQLVKKLWEYIKGNNLQNPADKREIILDEPLKKVFKINKFTAFSMNRYLNNVVKKE